MKQLFLTLTCAGLAIGGSARASEATWHTDFEAAMKTAAETDKSMLVNFTGSDWCGWCIKLHDEVFSKEAFQTGVADDFVLVEIDYPRDKSDMSAETIEQNEALKERYAIRGYPTIFLMDEKGRPFARTGYREGGAEGYVEHLEEFMEMRKERDEALAKAKSLEGEAKAAALVEAVRSMDLGLDTIGRFYGDVIEQIKKADPADSTGYVKQVDMEAKLAEFRQELQTLARSKQMDKGLELIETVLAEEGFEGEPKQEILFTKSMVLAQMGRFDEALDELDKTKAIAPESKIGQRVDQVKEQMKKFSAEQSPQS